MASFSNILVAVDLSEEADQVIAAGAELASITRAEISVVHVAHALTYYGDAPYYVSPIDRDLYNQDEVRKILFDELDKLVEPYDITRGSIDIRFGYAAEEVVRKAKDDGVDLIVLGTHGRRGIRLLLGSTADRVLHHAPCNVLAIRILDQ